MAKFEIGDRVAPNYAPHLRLTVVEVGRCGDGPDCPLGTDAFRYDDVDGDDADWVHAANYEKA